MFVYGWTMNEIAARVVDSALELSIVGSFSRVGPAVRRRLDDWRDPRPGCLAGKTALVTGPTSGLGRATALSLAELGARVVLAGRSETRLAELSDELAERTGEQRYPWVAVDMASLVSVRGAVNKVLATESRLDVLVDNAGAIYPERGETADGIERTLAVLVVGPFALVSGLLPLLANSPSARVIAVTSGGMYAQPVDLADLQWANRPYVGARAYAQGKRIQVALIREWARRAAPTNVSFNAMHPGWADTPGLAESLPGFYRVMRPLLRSVDEGADTIRWLATEPDLRPPGGKLYLDRRARPFDRVPWTRLSREEREELWDEIAELALRDSPST
jgi:NAD(P)-dependent dehydrogenase (short-subunit alcohol dehydrogenase family)